MKTKDSLLPKRLAKNDNAITCYEDFDKFWLRICMPRIKAETEKAVKKHASKISLATLEDFERILNMGYSYNDLREWINEQRAWNKKIMK